MGSWPLPANSYFTLSFFGRFCCPAAAFAKNEVDKLFFFRVFFLSAHSCVLPTKALDVCGFKCCLSVFSLPDCLLSPLPPLLSLLRLQRAAAAAQRAVIFSNVYCLHSSDCCSWLPSPSLVPFPLQHPLPHPLTPLLLPPPSIHYPLLDPAPSPAQAFNKMDYFLCARRHLLMKSAAQCEE